MFETVRELKEQSCYVVGDYDAAMKTSDSEFESDYSLPDGRTIRFGKERFRCPEVFFNPKVAGFDHESL